MVILCCLVIGSFVFIIYWFKLCFLLFWQYWLEGDIFIIFWVVQQDLGQYICNVISFVGYVEVIIILYVESLLYVIMVLEYVLVQVGEMVQFQCLVYGIFLFIFQWSCVGSSFFGRVIVRNELLYFECVVFEDLGCYCCWVINKVGLVEVFVQLFV